MVEEVKGTLVCKKTVKNIKKKRDLLLLNFILYKIITFFFQSKFPIIKKILLFFSI